MKPTMRFMNKDKTIKTFNAHGLKWIYYKDSYGNYRYVAPISNRDSGPFYTLKAMRGYIKTWGANINWQ